MSPKQITLFSKQVLAERQAFYEAQLGKLRHGMNDGQVFSEIERLNTQLDALLGHTSAEDYEQTLSVLLQLNLAYFTVPPSDLPWKQVRHVAVLDDLIDQNNDDVEKISLLLLLRIEAEFILSIQRAEFLWPLVEKISDKFLVDSLYAKLISGYQAALTILGKNQQYLTRYLPQKNFLLSRIHFFMGQVYEAFANAKQANHHYQQSVQYLDECEQSANPMAGGMTDYLVIADPKMLSADSIGYCREQLNSVRTFAKTPCASPNAQTALAAIHHIKQTSASPESPQRLSPARG